MEKPSSKSLIFTYDEILSLKNWPPCKINLTKNKEIKNRETQVVSKVKKGFNPRKKDYGGKYCFILFYKLFFLLDHQFHHKQHHHDVLIVDQKKKYGGVDNTEIIIRKEMTAEERKMKEYAEKRKHQKRETDPLETKVNFTLNRLTPDNYEKLFHEEVISLMTDSAESSKKLVDGLFKKAWKEKIYAKLYAQMCKDLTDKEKKTKKGQFKRDIITVCEQTFKNRNKEEDEKKLEDFKDEEEKELYIKRRRDKLFGSKHFFSLINYSL